MAPFVHTALPEPLKVASTFHIQPQRSSSSRHIPGCCWCSTMGLKKKEKQNSAVRETANIDADGYLTSWRLAAVVSSLYLGTLLVAIDTTIISVAVPKISTVFKALDDIAWYGSAYLLTVTACQPSFGNFYKYFNVKYTYLASIIVFEGMMYQPSHSYNHR